MLLHLCDIVLPAEPPHPSAGAIGVDTFLDEWVSAPYPQMQADRKVILSGLAALDDATRAQWGVPFVNADLSQQTTMFDGCCAGNQAQVAFSKRLIELVCAGYYTTREGHAAIGYAGNVGLPEFLGPPPYVLRVLEKALSEVPTV